MRTVIQRVGKGERNSHIKKAVAEIYVDDLILKEATADLSLPGETENLYKSIKKRGIEIEYLVNNAGFGILGKTIQESDPGRFIKMLRINVMALSELTLLFLPEMIRRKRGYILNVSSMAGYIVPHGVGAGSAPYGAFLPRYRW